MTIEQWTKEVKKQLIEKNESISKMCNEIGYTRAWVYVAFKGKASKETYTRINEYLGITTEVEI